MSRKRCIIIGSGLGGLSCGTILARNGYDVTVVEQGARAGGCLQCFVRHGVKFETGMHFIGSARPGEPLHRLLRFLELDNLPLNPLDPDGYNRVKIGGDEFAVIAAATDEDAVKAAVETLRRLCAEWDAKEEYPVSIAVGYAMQAGRTMTADELFMEADAAMYQNKAEIKKAVGGIIR